jgi:hypothetical protein
LQCLTAFAYHINVMIKSAKLSPRDLDLIRNFLIGGAAAGGAAGLATSALNHAQTLTKEQPSSADDDDTLYLNMPRNKQAVIGGGLALAGGSLAALGSYAAVRKIHQAIKKKRLQEQLDLAQRGYVGVVENEADFAKGATQGKPMSLFEALTSSAVAVPLLLALGSGVMTHKALSQAFPSPRKRLTTGPRRVVINKREDEEPVKAAAYSSDDGMEFLLNLVLGTKEAHLSELPDLVFALAQGREAELSSLSRAQGVDAMLSMTKGASLLPLDEKLRTMAISYAVKSAEFGPLIKVMAAAEFANAYPVFFKMAGELPRGLAEPLAGLISVLGAAGRADVFEGHLRANTELEDAPAHKIASILQSVLGQQEAPSEQLTDAQDTDNSGGEDEDDPTVDKDLIDQILSGADDERDEVITVEPERQQARHTTLTTQQA